MIMLFFGIFYQTLFLSLYITALTFSILGPSVRLCDRLRLSTTPNYEAVENEGSMRAVNGSPTALSCKDGASLVVSCDQETYAVWPAHIGLCAFLCMSAKSSTNLLVWIAA